MERTGDNPSTKSTSGRLTFSNACLACVDKLSTYLRCPSAAITSKTREDFEALERRGYQRVRIDKCIKRLDDYDLLPTKSAGREFVVELVIDRFVINESNRSRLADSLELAFKEGGERAIAWVDKGEQKKEINLSESLACESCGAV